MNRSAGDGRTCGECDHFSRTTRPGRHRGWCIRPGQVFNREDVSPDTDACNVFKDK